MSMQKPKWEEEYVKEFFNGGNPTMTYLKGREFTQSLLREVIDSIPDDIDNGIYPGANLEPVKASLLREFLGEEI